MTAHRLTDIQPDNNNKELQWCNNSLHSQSVKHRFI